MARPWRLSSTRRRRSTTTVGRRSVHVRRQRRSGGSGTVTGAGGLSTAATSLTYTGDQVNAGTYYVTATTPATPTTTPATACAVAIVINKAASVTTTTSGDGRSRYDATTHSGRLGHGHRGRRPELDRDLGDLHRRPGQRGHLLRDRHYAGDANHEPSDGAAVGHRHQQGGVGDVPRWATGRSRMTAVDAHAAARAPCTAPAASAPPRPR